ncbi:MAG: ParB N-terminal domain-containing protein, partial [Hyphomicrobiales bacterium]|nr:ParB N-terminal domain-containing protein [Hyphomicrobiales bacterium]
MTTRRRTDDSAPLGVGAELKRAIGAGNRERREGLRRLSAAQSASVAGSQRNDLLPPLELIELRLDDLKLGPRRLRKLDPAHVREVANSIVRLGFSVPVLVGKGNVVINGEVAVAAARLVGLDRIPCVRVGHLSESEQRVLRLAVNRLAEKGEWDLEALKIEFSELITLDAPIEIAGFAPDEIDAIVCLDPVDGVERGPLAPKPGVAAVARRGDLYLCGRHRVLCGDAADHATLRRLMAAPASGGAMRPPGRRAALPARNRPLARLMLTDEPFNVPIAGNVTNGPHREFVMASGEMSPAEYLAFNEAWMAAVLPHLVSGGVLATFIDWRGYPTVDAAALSLS